MNYPNQPDTPPVAGDIIAVDISGVKYPFVVVSLSPVNFPGSGNVGAHPEQFLACVPFDALKQVNIKAGDTQLWSTYANTNAQPVVPPVF